MFELTKCPHCGSENFKDTEFCLICRERLSSPIAAQPQSTQPSQEKTVLYLAAAAVALLVVAAYFGISSFFSSRPAASPVAIETESQSENPAPAPVADPREPTQDDFKAIFKSSNFTSMMKESASLYGKRSEDKCVDMYGGTAFDSSGKVDHDKVEKLREDLERCRDEARNQTESEFLCGCQDSIYSGLEHQLLEKYKLTDFEKYKVEGRVTELIDGNTKYFKILKHCGCKSNFRKATGRVIFQLQKPQDRGWELMYATKIP